MSTAQIIILLSMYEEDILGIREEGIQCILMVFARRGEFDL